MKFQPRRKFSTISPTRHHNIVKAASLVVLIARMVITTMIVRSKGIISICKLQYIPIITTAWAWIPHRLQNDHHRIRRCTPRGSNEDNCRYSHTNPTCNISKHRYGSMVTTLSRCYSSSSESRSSTTSIQGEEMKDSDEVVTEATHMAMSICGDDLSVKACSTFGGLKYYNTDIDNRFRVLFVLGGPGSGKGTQSALMEENYPVAHFSVGELLRNVPHDSPHKATIDAKLVAGQIVPVEISLSLLRAAMEATPSKHTIFLVDGFPRNYDNLSGWCRVMSQVAALESVLVYQCPFPVLQERILERAKISGRSDDNIESVKKRFKTFESETVPVVEILRSVSEKCPSDRQRWSVVDISGDRSLEDVWASTQQILNQLIQHDVLTANAALLTAIQSYDVQAYERLCDPLFFKDKDAKIVMQQQEGKSDQVPEIQSANIDIISGRQASVTYDRLLDGVIIQEKRFWSHQGIAGWRNVHFIRTP